LIYNISFRLSENGSHYDLRNYSFANRIVNIWNSLPNAVKDYRGDEVARWSTLGQTCNFHGRWRHRTVGVFVTTRAMLSRPTASMGVDHGGQGEGGEVPPEFGAGDANANCPPPQILSYERSVAFKIRQNPFSVGPLARTPVRELTTLPQTL